MRIITLLAVVLIGCGGPTPSIAPEQPLVIDSARAPSPSDLEAAQRTVAEVIEALQPRTQPPEPYDFEAHYAVLKARLRGLQLALDTGDPQAFDTHRAAGRALVRTVMQNGGFPRGAEIRFNFGSTLDGTPARAALLTYDGPIGGTASDDILAGCRVERGKPSGALTGLCPNFRFSIAVPHADNAAHALESFARLIAHEPYASKHDPQPGPNIDGRPLQFVLGQHTLLGRRFVEAETVADVLFETQTLAVAFKRTQRILIATCFTDSRAGHQRTTVDDACRRVIATLIERPVPNALLVAPRVFPHGTFAGKALLTPKGCQRDGSAERIRCGGGGQLSWQLEGLMTRDDRIRTVIETLQDIPTGIASTLVDRAMPCTVDGVDATCVHIHQDIKGGRDVHYYFAKAEVRGEQLLAMCSGTAASPDRGPPSPCDQVLDWPRTPTAVEGTDIDMLKHGQTLMASGDFAAALTQCERLLAQLTQRGAADTPEQRDVRVAVHVVMAQALRGLDAYAHANPEYCSADRNPRQAAVAHHTAMARDLLAGSCDAGHPKSCANLGVAILTDDCGTKEGMTAAYRKGCEGGILSACVELGNLHMSGTQVPVSAEKATVFYRKACTAGLAEGCAHLAFQYDLGKGVAVDGPRALKLLSDACDAGSMTGCNGLGLLHQRGRHVEEDLVKARGFFEKGCAGRHPHACARLGDFTYHGMGGLDADPVVAARLWDRACEVRSGHGCLTAGAAYERGEGVEADMQVATRLYDLACRLGHPSGCFNLGNEYAKGNVLPQDFDQARIYWKRACSKGHEKACIQVKNHTL